MRYSPLCTTTSWRRMQVVEKQRRRKSHRISLSKWEREWESRYEELNSCACVFFGCACTYRRCVLDKVIRTHFSFFFFFFGSVFSSHYARFCGQLFMAERTQSPVITTFFHLLDMLVPAPSVVYGFATVVAAPPRATPSVAAPPKSCTDFSTPCTETMKNLCG